MSTATASSIQNLTLAYFGRPADPASLIGWPATGLTLNQIVQIYVNTAEYRSITFDPNSVLNASGGRTVNDTTLINTFYVRLFGRNAAAVEIAGWTNALATGAVNYDFLGITMLNAGLNLPTTGEAGAMRAVLQAKIDSSSAYTTAIATTAGAAVAYSTATAIQDGITYNLSTTTSTAKTTAQASAAVVTMTAGSNANAGQTFTLTTSIETVPATGAIAMPASSTVSGILAAGTANGQTFQTGDTINANATSDVNITVLGNQANTVSINNARSVNFRNLAGGALAAADNNAILWNNVGTFSSTASGAGLVGLSNGALATTYALVNPLIDSSAGLNVTYRGADIIGATDTAKFSVTGVGSSSSTTVAANAALTINTNSTGATATGVETVAIATAGTNIVDMNFGTNTSRVNVTGAGANTLNMLAGGIVATAQFYDLTGATGANTLDVAATLATSSTVTGGTGSDTLYVTPSGVALTNLSVSAVETLRLRNAAAAGILGFTGAPAFSTIRMAASGTDNTAAVVTLLNGLSSTQALAYRGADTAATIAAAQIFNGLTGTGALTGAADTLNIAFSNSGRALTGNAAYTAGVITALGVETVAVSTADSATTGVTALTGIASDTMSSFTATGTGVVTAALTGTNAVTLGSLSTINLSGLASTAARSGITVAANSLAAASTLTASVGGTGLILTAETATDTLIFNGGAGVDVISSNGLTADTTSTFTGFVNFNGGAGNDIIFLTNSAGVTANGGDDNDILTGSGAIDTLRGDAGNDTITGGLSNDVLTGGTGNDRFVYAAEQPGQTAGGTAGTATSTSVTAHAAGGAGTATLSFTVDGIATTAAFVYGNTTTAGAIQTGLVAAINAAASGSRVFALTAADGANSVLTLTATTGSQVVITGLTYSANAGTLVAPTIGGGAAVVATVFSQIDSITDFNFDQDTIDPVTDFTAGTLVGSATVATAMTGSTLATSVQSLFTIGGALAANASFGLFSFAGRSYLIGNGTAVTSTNTQGFLQANGDVIVDVTGFSGTLGANDFIA